MLIAGLAASAQTPVAIDSLLPTAYIVGSQRRATSPRQRLAGQQLHAFDGHSVANALRYFAGLQVKDYGGIGGMKTIDVRGMGSTHVGVFLDGMPVANEQNGQVDFARFETDGLERVELYNGHRTQLLQSAREYASGSTATTTAPCEFMRTDTRKNTKAMDHGYWLTMPERAVFISSR